MPFPDTFQDCGTLKKDGKGPFIEFRIATGAGKATTRKFTEASLASYIKNDSGNAETNSHRKNDTLSIKRAKAGLEKFKIDS